MKKSIYGKLVIVLCVAIIGGLVLLGAKEEEKKPEAPTKVAEEPMEDMDAVDPYILKIRDPWDKYNQYDPEILKYKGPLGETPEFDRDLVLTKAEVAKLRAGKPDGTPYTYVFSQLTYGNDAEVAMWGAARDFLDYCGLKFLAQADANFDAAKQKNDIETLMALDPDLVIAFPIGATAGAENLRPVVDAGKVLTLVSVVPDGYEYGREFVGIATNNAYGKGIYCAQKLAELVGRNATVGQIFFDANFPFVNIQDDAFRDYMKTKRPDIKVIERGFQMEPDCSQIASALALAYPEMEGLYVTWMIAAMHAVAGLIELDRPDVNVVTFGFDEPAIINMLQGGNMKAIIVDAPYPIGLNMAIQGCYGLLNKPNPPRYVICPTVILTNDNLREVWEIALHTPIPKPLEEELRKAGL